MTRRPGDYRRCQGATAAGRGHAGAREGRVRVGYECCSGGREPMVARRWSEPRCSRVLAEAALRWQADVVVATDAQSFEIVIVGGWLQRPLSTQAVTRGWLVCPSRRGRKRPGRGLAPQSLSRRSCRLPCAELRVLNARNLAGLELERTVSWS